MLDEGLRHVRRLHLLDLLQRTVLTRAASRPSWTIWSWWIRDDLVSSLTILADHCGSLDLLAVGRDQDRDDVWCGHDRRPSSR